MAIAVTVDSSYAQNDTTQATQIVRGTLVFSGSYATHGDVLNFQNIYGIQSRSVPIRVFVYEAPPAGTDPSGWIYTFCPGTTNANGKVVITGSAGFTPAGTISAPTITTLTNAGTTAPVYVNGGALTETTGATGITGVQAPTFTGTAVAAAAPAQLGAGAYPAGITGAVVKFEAIFPVFV